MKLSVSQVIPVLEAVVGTKVSPLVILQLAQVYAAYEADTKAGPVTMGEYVDLAIQVATIGKNAGITWDDIIAILTALKPLVASASAPAAAAA